MKKNCKKGWAVVGLEPSNLARAGLCSNHWPTPLRPSYQGGGKWVEGQNCGTTSITSGTTSIHKLLCLSKYIKASFACSSERKPRSLPLGGSACNDPQEEDGLYMMDGFLTPSMTKRRCDEPRGFCAKWGSAGRPSQLFCFFAKGYPGASEAFGFLPPSMSG